MKNRNWFWGIFFLAAAVFVIACQVGAFISIGFWSIVATVLLAAVFVSSLVELNFFGVFVSAALLYLIYQGPLHWPSIAAWLLLLAAVLASIGFSFIFHPHGHKHWDHCSWHDSMGIESYDKTVENIDGNDIFVKASFSEACKYLHSDSLKTAYLKSSFGKLSVYFDQVQPNPEGSKVSVDASFGEMVLYIPQTWRVIDHIHANFGAVESDERNAPLAADVPTLTLTGKVSFGSLAIHFV